MPSPLFAVSFNLLDMLDLVVLADVKNSDGDVFR
jgi:hypothetical protein